MKLINLSIIWSNRWILFYSDE